MNTFTKRFNHFISGCDPSNLQSYFNIKDHKISIKKFDDLKCQGYCILSIEYERINKYINRNSFMNLPPEINNEIMSYLPEYIKLKFKIEFPLNYPFSSPVWTFNSIAHNLDVSINLEHYYKYIIKKHNKNMDNWTPAIYIDTDVIYFLSKINNFEYIK